MSRVVELSHDVATVGELGAEAVLESADPEQQFLVDRVVTVSRPVSGIL